jgi:hypothetical protein
MELKLRPIAEQVMVMFVGLYGTTRIPTRATRASVYASSVARAYVSGTTLIVKSTGSRTSEGVVGCASGIAKGTASTGRMSVSLIRRIGHPSVGMAGGESS